MSAAPPVISLLWLLGMLAAALLVFRPRGPARPPLAAAAAFAAGGALALWATPRPEAAGVLIALVAAWAALSTGPAWLEEMLAGLLAALAAGLFAAGGMAAWLALAVSGGPLALALLWSGGRSPVAASVPGAFAAIACASLVVAATPGVLEGWRAGQALDRAAEVAAHTPPAWTLALVGAAVAAGLLRGLLARR